MDLLWIILPLLLGRVQAQNRTEVPVELGQSTTLNCSITDIDKIYWYLEIHSSFRTRILDTNSKDPSQNTYYIHPHKTKYEGIEGRRLVIRNITADDCRLYFCARRKNGSIHFVDTFSIVSGDSNKSEANRQHISRIWQSDVVTFSSVGLNLLLLLVVTGLVSKSLCCTSRTCKNQEKQSDGFDCENPESVESPQYEEIQLDRAAPPPSDCIYSTAQHPRPTLPRH